MKLGGLALPFLAVAAFTTSALAQNAAVSVEKKGYQVLSPDIYGSIEVRHSVIRAQNGDRVANDIPALSVRPTLGLKLFDGKAKSAFTLSYRKTPGSMVVSKVALFNETMWTVFQGEHTFISPYAYSEFDPDRNAFRFANVGVNFSAKNAYESSLGKVSVGAYIEPKVQVVSSSAAKAEDFRVVPRNDTSIATLAFDEQGNTWVEQRDPTLVDDAGVSVRMSPAKVSKLFTGLSMDVYSQWKPKYVAVETPQGGVDTNLNGYERRSLTTSRWSLGWNATDKLSFVNSVSYFMGGLYQYPIQNALAETNHELGKNRWENRFSVNAVLF